MPRTIFSPTTTPIEPPMKLYSIDATTASMPLIRPTPTITASFWPVDFCVAARRDLYGLVSVNFSGSFEVRFGRNLLPPLIVEQRLQPLGGAQAEVVRALAADVQVLDRDPWCR